MRAFSLFASLFLLLGIFTPGCSTQKGKALQPVKLASFQPIVSVDLLWSASTGKLDRYYHTFRIDSDDKAVYAASRQGDVTAFDKKNGQVLWHHVLDKRLTAALTIDESKVYVGTRDGRLLALDKQTGLKAWSAQLSSELVAPPSVASDHLIVHTNDGAIADFDTENGNKRWQHEGNMPSLTLRGASQPVIFAPYTAVGFANGTLGILDINTGQLRWQDRVTTPKGSTEIERLVDIDSQPLVHEGKLFTVSYQGNVQAYNVKTGKKIWSRPVSSFRNMAISYDGLFITADTGEIIAYDPATGRKLWKQEGLLGRKPSSVAVQGDFLIVTDLQGYLHVLDAGSGRFIGRRSLTLPDRPRVGQSKLPQVKRLMKPRPGIRTTAFIDGQTVYVLADNGQLGAYAIKTKAGNS